MFRVKWTELHQIVMDHLVFDFSVDPTTARIMIRANPTWIRELSTWLSPRQIASEIIYLPVLRPASQAAD